MSIRAQRLFFSLKNVHYTTYFYHGFWDESLRRGELSIDYEPIYLMKIDKEKMNEEKAKKRAEEERLKREERQKIEEEKARMKEKEEEFNKTGFGSLLNAINDNFYPRRKMLSPVSEEDFLVIMYSRISRRLTIGFLNNDFSKKLQENGLFTLTVTSKDNEIANIKFDNISLPVELESTILAIVPTDIGFIGNEFCISKAIILYINDKVSLKYSDYLFKEKTCVAGNVFGNKNKEIIVQGLFFVSKIEDNFVYRGFMNYKDIVLEKLGDSKIKNGKCYYALWENSSENIVSLTNKITQEEVMKSFEVRYKEMQEKEKNNLQE